MFEFLDVSMFIRYTFSDTSGIYCQPHNTLVLTKKVSTQLTCLFVALKKLRVYGASFLIFQKRFIV